MADETFTKEQLDAAVEKATGDVQGLKDKIDELIGDNKKLKADLRKTQDIKPEDVAAIEAERDKALSDLAAAQKAAKDATAAAEKATKALEAEVKYSDNLVGSEAARALLHKGGVTDPDYLDLALAKIGPLIKVVRDGEGRKAMVGDKALEDDIAERLGTDWGKKIVAAPVNGGGGAGGGGAKTEDAKTIPRAEFDAMSQSDRMKFTTDGGKPVDEPT